jgi:xylulokinase
MDTKDEVVRPALLWNDLRSAPQITTVIDHLGGAQETADTIGSVPPASFTITKLRWLYENEPENARKTATVLLPHDWLTWLLGGRKEKTTDHGDASGTGYYSPTNRRWLPELAAWALGRDRPPNLPQLAEPAATVGHTATGALVAAGTGDNMAAAMGLNLTPGDVAVSIGPLARPSASRTPSPPTPAVRYPGSRTPPVGTSPWSAR